MRTPWIAVKYTRHWDVEDVNGVAVATHLSEEEAKLIAAAPEMLKALDRLGQACANEWGPRFRESSVGRQAIAAINKAQGK